MGHASANPFNLLQRRREASGLVVEVRVEWGEGDPLRVTHGDVRRAYVVGDGSSKRAQCDFELDACVSGVARWELVTPLSNHSVIVHPSPGSRLTFVASDGSVWDDQALSAGQRLLAHGGELRALVLHYGEAADVAFGDFVFRIALTQSETRQVPSVGRAASLAAIAGAALTLVVAASLAHSSGAATSPERYVDATIDLTHPAVAALVARRAAAPAHATPTYPRTSPSAIPAVAPSSVTPDSERLSPASAPPATQTPAAPPAPARAQTDSAVPRATTPAPSTTAATPTADPATADADSTEAETDDDRRLATMFSMRRGLTGLDDCYARFPVGGATDASQLRACIADARQVAATRTRHADDASPATPEPVALVEWNIEVEGTGSGPTRAPGGRMFVAIQP